MVFDATISFVMPVDQELGFNPLLLKDVEVHDILGGVFELAQLLLETCIKNKQIQKPIQSWYVGQLRSNEQDANLGGPPWTSP
jgi:hypothetical protein